MTPKTHKQNKLWNILKKHTYIPEFETPEEFAARVNKEINKTKKDKKDERN